MRMFRDPDITYLWIYAKGYDNIQFSKNLLAQIATWTRAKMIKTGKEKRPLKLKGEPYVLIKLITSPEFAEKYKKMKTECRDKRVIQEAQNMRNVRLKNAMDSGIVD